MTQSFENYENKFLEEESKSKGSKSNTDHVRRIYERAETSSSGRHRQQGGSVPSFVGWNPFGERNLPQIQEYPQYPPSEASSSRLQRQRRNEVSRGKQPEIRENDLYYSFSRASPSEQLQRELKELVKHCCFPQGASTRPQIGVGQQLGNYRLVDFLGEGGFGKVFLGEHISSKGLVAVKVLPHTDQKMQKDVKKNVEKFCKEIEYMACLNHPNIVPLLEFGSKDKVPFLVMEYMPHGPLHKAHSKGKRLYPMQVVEYVKQIASALDYMHNDQKLIHRDIKPENLLLRAESEVLVGDLGLAAPVGTTGTTGTFEYMAPEQLNGNSCPASDQYALGVVAYRLLSGKHPLRGPKGERAYSRRWVNLDDITSTSNNIRWVLACALHRNPNRRFSNVTAFAQAFEQACWEWSQHHLQGRSVAAVRHQAFEQAAVDQEQTQRRRRNRLAVGHHQAFEQAAADQEQTQCRRRNRPAIEHHQAFERATTDQEQTQQQSSKKGLCRYVKRFLKKLSGCVWSRCYTSQDDARLARIARISNSEEDVPSLEPCSECELMNLI